MKEILSTIVTIGTIVTNQPNKYKEIKNNTQIENKLKQNKAIGIKKKHVVKHASYKKMAGKQMMVGATAYYGDPITYTGTVPKVGHTIAVDPKVIPLGSRVYIPQFNKIFIAEDCGSAIKGNRIDIFMNTYDECMEWGYKDITIIILED